MQLTSQTMKDLFQHFFDAEVAVLANILFPKANATVDLVRSLRRPSTAVGRRGEVVA